jgi:hypothetical protein
MNDMSTLVAFVVTSLAVFLGLILAKGVVALFVKKETIDEEAKRLVLLLQAMEKEKEATTSMKEAPPSESPKKR